MKFIKKYRLEISTIIIIVITYFISRLYTLMQLPIFTDEAIYVRWAQIAYNDSAWRFISLTDGKQPSFIWMHMVTLRLFDDPLFAGRIVSVFAGVFTLIGIYILAQLLFKNKNISLMASILYVTFPFAIIYDRLAIYDSTVAMFFVWSLTFSVLLIKKLRLDVALILGFILGGAVLTKSSGFLSIYLSPLMLLIFNLKRKGIVGRFLKWVMLMGIAVIIAYIMYSIQRLSPFFHIIEQKNSTFVYPLADWIKNPLGYLIGNLYGMVDWLIKYMTVPILFLSISSFFLGIKNNYREKALLFLWFLGPFLGLAVFGKLIYPRFIFFMTIPLLILSAYSLIYLIGRVKNILLKFAILALFMSMFLYSGYKILTDFKNAPIPKIDLEQFINGWPAGGGIRESIDYFKEKAKEKEIVIATEGTFGLMPYSYEIYLNGKENIEVRGYWPIEDSPPEELMELSKTKDIYFVFYQPCPGCEYPGDAPDTWPLEKISEFEKGDSRTTLTIYKLKTE